MFGFNKKKKDTSVTPKVGDIVSWKYKGMNNHRQEIIKLFTPNYTNYLINNFIFTNFKIIAKIESVDEVRSSLIVKIEDIICWGDYMSNPNSVFHNYNIVIYKHKEPLIEIIGPKMMVPISGIVVEKLIEPKENISFNEDDIAKIQLAVEEKYGINSDISKKVTNYAEQNF